MHRIAKAHKKEMICKITGSGIICMLALEFVIYIDVELVITNIGCELLVGRHSLSTVIDFGFYVVYEKHENKQPNN
jgi:hypothetical protein